MCNLFMHSLEDLREKIHCSCSTQSLNQNVDWKCIQWLHDNCASYCKNQIKVGYSKIFVSIQNIDVHRISTLLELHGCMHVCYLWIENQNLFTFECSDLASPQVPGTPEREKTDDTKPSEENTEKTGVVKIS